MSFAMAMRHSKTYCIDSISTFCAKRSATLRATCTRCARGPRRANHADRCDSFAPGLPELERRANRRTTAFVSHALAHGAGRAAPARDRQGREHDRAPRRVHVRVRVLVGILAATRAPARSVSGRAATKARGRSRDAVRARLVTARAQRGRRSGPDSPCSPVRDPRRTCWG